MKSSRQDKGLYHLWKTYINRNIYRVVSSEYIPAIKKKGLNPKSDPYQKVKSDIEKLCDLVVRLEHKGFVHEQDWGFKKVDGRYIVMVSLEDLTSKFIDFTPYYKETLYYKKRHGGAMVQTIKEITSDIITRKPSLRAADYQLVKKLNEWSRRKSQYKNRTLFFKGSSRYFETALFQHRLGKFDKDKYWESPFGRFEHFKQIIEKYGLTKYEPFLKGEARFYLRLIDKMPAKEIRKIR